MQEIRPDCGSCHDPAFCYTHIRSLMMPSETNMPFSVSSLLVAADDSKLMLVVKCGLTGVVGCVIYVLVSMILKQNIIADTIKKFKK